MLATVCDLEASGAEVSGLRVTAGFRELAAVCTGGLACGFLVEVFADGLDAFAVARLPPDFTVPRTSSRNTWPALMVQGGPMPLALPNSR
ncbi:MAG: hypothetical protein ACTHZH_04610 [Oleiphilaceae bacterium]